MVRKREGEREREEDWLRRERGRLVAERERERGGREDEE